MTGYRLFACLPLLIAAPALAQSPFDGTWKADLTSLASKGKPESEMLKGGTYGCSTCTPPYTVAADGAFHAMSGHDYWDEVAVTDVDPRTAKFQYRKAGKLVSETTATVAADGNTVTYATLNTNNGGNVPVTSTVTATRVGATVPGAHLISGQWQPNPPTSVSEQGLSMTMSISAGTLHLRSGLGETLEAKLGGDYAPDVGDPGGTMTKAERLGPQSIRLTDKRGGKVVEVSTYTIAADGRLHGSWSDPETGRTGSFVAMKQ